MAVACICVPFAPRLHAQNPGQVTITDPTEYHAYQGATAQSDPGAKAFALESFLQTYPQSVVKKTVLDLLVDTYQSLGDADKALSAARRLLEADPNNMQAVFRSVVIKRSQCIKTSDAQTCDDAAQLASEGLAMSKPPDMSDGDWRKQTGATFPIFHSAIAMDDALSKKDFKAAISEYRTELMLFPPDQTKSGPGLVDTLNLAEAYVKPDANDLVQAVWFYSRAWNFAPPVYKAQIEPKIEYYYKKYHGGLDGIDEVKIQSATTLFPPGTMVNEPAAPLAASPASVPAQRKYEDIAPPPQPADAPPATIALGQTKDQVTAAFGQPVRIAKLGVKEIFYYKDMKVTFTNGKVSNVE
jgi:tetratricopeptide (TPR) repeat protein